MRRSNHRILPRPLRLVLAFVALLAAGALPAHAQETPPAGSPPASDPMIVLNVNDQRLRERPWSDFADVRDVRQRTVLLPDGSTKVVDGITLRALLEKFVVGTTAYTAVETTSEDGSQMKILATQILQDVGSQVLLYVDEQGVLHLLRPRTDEDGRPIEVATAVNGALNLSLVAGASLDASPRRARVNQLVTFTVTPPPGLDPAAIEYEWNFNNDELPVRNRRTTMSKSFKRSGDYNPIVTLYIGGIAHDDLPPSVEVNIVEAPPIRDRSAQEPGRRRGDGRGGRSRGGGEGTGGDGSGSGGATTGGGTGSGSGGAGTTSPPASAPTAPPAPAAPSPPVTPPPAPRPRAEPRPRPRARATPPAPAGESVTGYLLASAAGVPLAAGGGQSARARPAETDGDPLQIPAVAWVLFGIAGVVMLGWALESRTTLPYFKP